MEDPTGWSFFPFDAHPFPPWDPQHRQGKRQSSSRTRPHHHNKVPPLRPTPGVGAQSVAATIASSDAADRQQAAELECAIRSLEREVFEARKARVAHRRPKKTTSSPSKYLLRVRLGEQPHYPLLPASNLGICGVTDWIQSEVLCQLSPIVDGLQTAAHSFSDGLLINQLDGHDAALFEEVSSLTRQLVHSANKLLFFLRTKSRSRSASQFHDPAPPCEAMGNLRQAVVERLKPPATPTVPAAPVASAAPATSTASAAPSMRRISGDQRQPQFTGDVLHPPPIKVPEPALPNTIATTAHTTQITTQVPQVTSIAHSVTQPSSSIVSAESPHSNYRFPPASSTAHLTPRSHPIPQHVPSIVPPLRSMPADPVPHKNPAAPPSAGSSSRKNQLSSGRHVPPSPHNAAKVESTVIDPSTVASPIQGHTSDNDEPEAPTKDDTPTEGSGGDSSGDHEALLSFKNKMSNLFSQMNF